MKDVMNARPLRIASLFAGAGGLDLGFKNAGYEIIWANDNDFDAVETYKENIGDHCFLGDIAQVDFHQLPDVDGVIGGFPCQGFSVANTGRGIDDSRNLLYKSFVALVETKKPKFFLAENVKGILSLGKGEVFRHILKEFESVGYTCTYALVNASHYGVPQRRERVLILGVRNDLNIDPSAKWPPMKISEKEPPTVGDALSGLPDPDYPNHLTNHVYSKFKLKFNGYISNRFVDPNKPSPTITARGDHKGGAMIVHHPSNLRRMTCRETAVVQGFPLTYEFKGSMTSVYKQIGNAVPPPLAEAAAKGILEILSR